MSVKGKKSKSKKAVSKKKGPKMTLRQYVLFGILLLAIIAFIFSSLPSSTIGGGPSTPKPSSTSTPKPSPSPAPSSEPQFKEEGTLTFYGAEDEGEMRSIKIEVADNDNERARGMMYRKSIPNDTGMLFIMESSKPQSFYMRNTYVSLDIIFVDENFKILNIVKKTVPLTETNVKSEGNAKYVIEVAAGYTDAYRIRPGDDIRFELK